LANHLLDFTGGVLNKANETLQKMIETNEGVINKTVESADKSVSSANNTTTAAVNTAQTGTSLNLNNLIPMAIIGVVVIAGLMVFRKKG
jgi:hypothetical protein